MSTETFSSLVIVYSSEFFRPSSTECAKKKKLVCANGYL